MGVSGSGKTTLARALADTWPATFLDADDFHSTEAKAHMASGQPLTDAMRQPWVERIASDLVRRVEAGERIALAFSGLRRRHRDALRVTGLPLRFVYLQGEARLIAARMHARSGHYMPVSLLDSQFATLEDPRGEPDVVALPVDLAPEAQLQRALAALVPGARADA
ncbi:gluconokinase, GntK/IdnK-type [Pseudoxanthomonas daejeonensis]|uniref:gluconokinase n=1 Tax=Pseudoxanthomonas daejeonensis TaxID=266062 RepID=UPI001F54832B|nr:gluconokinase, GntK/IdnK-type [Pseudoxanthomonas daejeonensis]UNK59062.1 gluconokinase, GntK/IdnK-type [Pseudoxanthomonas daejeonensis]